MQVIEEDLEAPLLLLLCREALKDLAPLGDFHCRFGGVVGVGVGRSEARGEVGLGLELIVVIVFFFIFPLRTQLAKLVYEVEPRDGDPVLDVRKRLALREEGRQLVVRYLLLGQRRQALEAVKVLGRGGSVVDGEEGEAVGFVDSELVLEQA